MIGQFCEKLTQVPQTGLSPVVCDKKVADLYVTVSGTRAVWLPQTMQAVMEILSTLIYVLYST